MTTEFCKKVLQVIVGQTCQNMGWHAINSTPLELLVDIMHRYLEDLSRTTHRYCEQYGRTEPNLDDLGLAFQDIGVSLIELEEYMNNVDPMKPPFEVPMYPIPHKNSIFLETELDDQENSEDEETDMDAVAAVPTEPEIEESSLQQLNAEQNQPITTDGAPLKRIPPDPGDTPPHLTKRQRMISEEELSNMNHARDLTSVFMTSGGEISPAREGKLPDAKTPQYAVPVAQIPTPDSKPASAEKAEDPKKDGATPTKDDAPVDITKKSDSVDKKTTKKKPAGKPKKLNFNKKGSSTSQPKVAVNSDEKKDVSLDKDAVKIPAEKTKKKTPSKTPKSSKKSNAKNVDKINLSGITPLPVKGTSKCSVVLEKSSPLSTESSEGVKSSPPKKSTKQASAVTPKISDEGEKKDKPAEENSLDKTIEEVIQKAMQGDGNFSDKSMLTQVRGSRLRPKDVYDFSDSGGEGSEPASPKKPEAAPKEKVEPKLVVDVPDQLDPPKKKPRTKTKAARKEMYIDTNAEPFIHDVGLIGDADQSSLTSPFHNPPGFPSRPPLPLLHGFHSSPYPSFTTNLGPPPPAHQSTSTSNHPPLLPPSSFFPAFPPMQNLPQFADLAFSKMGMMPPFLSSYYSSMHPQPAHTPHLYNSANKIPEYSISSGADKPSPQLSETVSPPSTKPTPSSSSPDKQPPLMQCISIKSDPKVSAIQSTRLEIKPPPFSISTSEASSSAPKLVPERSDEKVKESKKEKKADKKEKSKKKDKDKLKSEHKEASEAVKSEKKEKSKSKEKKKKSKEDSSKDEPLQKITLKFGSSSKIFIKPVPSPVPEEEILEEKLLPVPSPEPVPDPPAKEPSPPPPPVPPVPPAPPPSTPIKELPESVSPPKEKSPRGRPRKNTPKPMPKKPPAIKPPSPISDLDEHSPSMSLITETVGATLDEDGNKIWICPKCGRPDDGSAMIGCDSCDDWYHWVCVKIVVPPKEEDSWFCTRCISKQHQQLSTRRKKKKHKRDRM